MKQIISVLVASVLSVILLASCSTTEQDGRNFVTAPPNLTVSSENDAVTEITYEPIAETTVPPASGGANTRQSLDEAKINSLIRGDEELQKQIATAKDSYKDVYRDVRAYAQGSSMVYEYDFLKTMTAEECARQREKMAQSLNSEGNIQRYTGIAAKLRDDHKVLSPKVVIIYKNGDNSVIYQKEYVPDTLESTTGGAS